MRKYRAYDEMTRTQKGLYVTLGPDGGVASVFVTHGPLGFTVTPAEYVERGFMPDFRSLPTRARIAP